MGRIKDRLAKMNQMADDVSELLELAEKHKLLGGYFDADVKDEAIKKAQGINDSGLMAQLEFMLENGWHKSRLAELIKEA